ncbi:MAG: YdcF family protein [Bacteroidales bacterium]
MRTGYKILQVILIFFGSVFLIMVILAFTSAPFWIWYKLSVKEAGIHRPPDYIIVMGGGGMPSNSGLMRCWYGALAANKYTKARVIIALPGNRHDSLSSVNLMKKEMELRGIAHDRIFLEDSGTNTRAEAVNVFKLVSDIENRELKIEPGRHPGPKSSIVNRQSSILVVSSPEHICRAVLTFKKAGFLKVDGLPAFEKTIEADLDFNASTLGARPWMPDVGSNITLRYQFWMQMGYEFLALREYIALAYYKLQGWL